MRKIKPLKTFYKSTHFFQTCQYQPVGISLHATLQKIFLLRVFLQCEEKLTNIIFLLKIKGKEQNYEKNTRDIKQTPKHKDFNRLSWF